VLVAAGKREEALAAFRKGLAIADAAGAGYMWPRGASPQ